MNADWRDRALCAEIDPELFFPEKGSSTREAKRVCRSCEVRAECLAWALAQPGELDGIWGGTAPMERRELRRDPAEQLTPRMERMERLAELRLHDGHEDVPPEETVTAAQAAELLGVSVRTVERYKRARRAAA